MNTIIIERVIERAIIRPRSTRWLACVLVVLCGSIWSDAAGSATVSAYIEAAAAKIPSQARSALRSIEGTPAQLLALRGYARADRQLPQRWSWTAQQIADYERSAEYRRLLAAIEEVNRRFRASNPGYSLFANTQVRSLDLQLERWNSNASVALAAQRIQASVQQELAQPDYPRIPDERATQRFMSFLRSLPPAVPVPLAVPGLSLHGQLRAIDFQIREDGGHARVIAGPQMSSVDTVWEQQGWAQRLARAVDTTQGIFAGPLKSPNEPWHYEYLH